jgi:hypothetical protein
LGCIFYEIFCNKTPFQAKTHLDLIYNIRNTKIDFPKDLDPDFIDLISNMLKVDQDERIDFESFNNHVYTKKILKKYENTFDELIKKKEIEIINDKETNDIKNNSEESEDTSSDEKDIKEEYVLLKSLKFNVLENEIIYPSVIFDYSSKKTNEQNLSYINEIETLAKKAWVIAEYAVSLNQKPNESAGLMLKSIELLNMILQKRIKRECQRTKHVLSWVRFRYNEFIECSKEYIKEIKHRYDVIPDQILYEYVINLVYFLINKKLKSNTLNDYLKKDDNLLVKYERSKLILDYLCFDTSLELSDKEIFEKCKIFFLKK